MSAPIDAPLVQAIAGTIGWIVLHSLWQGTLAAAAAALALRALDCASPAARYGVAYASLAAIAVLPAVTVLSPGGMPGFAPTGLSAWPAAGAGLAVATVLDASTPAIAVLWCAGVALLSLRIFRGWRVMTRLSTEAVLAPPAALAAQAARLARRMGIDRPVRVARSSIAGAVCVVGWTRPMILFPASVLAGLSPAHVEAILAHELAHIRRHDFAFNLVQMVLETVLFYHPAAWWLSRQVRREREHCCDRLAARVCGDAVEYARGLAALEHLRTPGASTMLAASADGALLQRVRRLTAPERQAPRGRPVLAAVALVTGLIAAAGIGVLPAGPAEAAGALSIGSAPLVLGALLGLLVGLRHTIEPDHLVTVATLVTGRRSAGEAARIGAAWGFGHAAALSTLFVAVLLAQRGLPFEVVWLVEAGVAVTLVCLGVRAIRVGRRLGADGPEVEHEHGALRHRHAGPRDHVHVGSWTLARQPLLIGLMHGIAGSGSVTALAIASLPTQGARFAFLVLFAAASTLAMAILAGCAGWSGGRLAPGRRAMAMVSTATGAMSILLGVAWGYQIFAP